MTCTPSTRRLLDGVFAHRYSKPQAAMAGALGGGVIVASLSHPMDTIKTCQQGDVTQKTYRGVVHAGVEITGTTSRRWRGAPDI